MTIALTYNHKHQYLEGNGLGYYYIHKTKQFPPQHGTFFALAHITMRWDLHNLQAIEHIRISCAAVSAVGKSGLAC